MDEFAKGLLNLVGVLLGALCTYGGFRIQGRLQEQARKKSLLAEKLERAYELCQLVYEGHRHEINNARINIPHDVDRFKKSRKHPGNEMSELRMLIKSYARDLDTDLESLGEKHGHLKLSFLDIDDRVIEMKGLSGTELETIYETWREDLVLLGDASSELKVNIADKLNELVK